jgi:hypothetical protein
MIKKHRKLLMRPQKLKMNKKKKMLFRKHKTEKIKKLRDNSRMKTSKQKT